MTQRPISTRDHPDAGWYEIRLSGQLGPRWTAWFAGLTVSEASDGTTIIAGRVADQAALHGLLQRVRDLGLELVSVNRTGPTPDQRTDDVESARTDERRQP